MITLAAFAAVALVAVLVLRREWRVLRIQNIGFRFVIRPRMNPSEARVITSIPAADEKVTLHSDGRLSVNGEEFGQVLEGEWTRIERTNGRWRAVPASEE